ncbi:MAG: hypothetical protein LBR13_07220 [Dysgonamonadaceae bacterium]|jgi:hypothetical protein|nr:hypothetical protein [Dysgonamonadaceae bacterium]
MRYYKLISINLLLLLTVSCSQNRTLESVLQLAGENRSELEKVIDHYSSSQNDSLKLRAAMFLIENMPGHYSHLYPERANAYYAELDTSVSIEYDKNKNKQIIESISDKYRKGGLGETVEDARVITAQFLIDNIDRAFDIWQNGEWATHLNFDEFCEYLLPYKGAELQPLDNWRSYASQMQRGEIDTLHFCNLYRNSAFQAATVVSKKIIELNRQDYPEGGTNQIPVNNLKTIAKMPFGSCRDYTVLALSVMRSKGIPVMEDFTPQWPFQPQSHSWNIVLTNKGKNMVFSAGTSSPGELHNPDARMAKVFRKCYAINKEIMKIHLTGEPIPSTFADFHLRDVTDEYMAVSNKDGVIPFSAPFVITPTDEIKRYVADNSQLQTMTVCRKYFIAAHCYTVGNRMKGGKFEAANHTDFRDAKIVHEIPDFTVQSGSVYCDTLATPYRFWRYFGAT